MLPVQQILPRVVRDLVRRMPPSDAKIAFAWKIVVGPAIERASEVRLRAGARLEVRTTNEAWRREIRRAAPMILERLRALVGAEEVREIVVI